VKLPRHRPLLKTWLPNNRHRHHNRLQVATLPAPVAELIREKAHGNPFFSEELAYALRDAGLIQIEGDACRLTPGADLQALSFPESVVSEASELGSCRYFDAGDQIAIVDPDEDKIVLIIDKG